MASPSEISPSFSSGRRFAIALNVGVAALMFFIIVVMVNFLSSRYFLRRVWSDDSRIRLSTLTEKVVKGLTNQMEIVIFFDQEDSLYPQVFRLLKEYRNLNSKIVLKTVDYVRNPVAARLAIAKYQLAASDEKDFVLFELGGRHRLVHGRELSEYDYQALLEGKSSEVKRKAFRGEQLFTSAILNLKAGRSSKAYFLYGHLEHNPEDKSEEGFGKFASILEGSNVKWERLSLQATNDIPADCGLLIIPGPKIALLEIELQKVENYLDKGGRLLVLLNNLPPRGRSGLEKILARWSVEVGDNVIREQRKTATTHDILTSEYGDSPHPIVKELVPGNLHLQLWRPRSIGKARSTIGGDNPTVTELVFTSNEATEVTDVREGRPYLNSYRDRHGVFPLMAAVEKGIKGVERGSTRIVVTGDSMFLANCCLQDPNYYFAGFAVNWLLAREEMLAGIGPRPVQQFTLNITRSQMKTVRWLLLVILPGAVLLLGGAVWLRRRA